MDKTEILYVDDEDINLMLFSKLFGKKYEIIAAKSGNEGIKKLSECPEIKIIVSDMRMPGMSGIEFIYQAKAQRPELKCFILTGYDITAEISEALKNRVIERHFTKPFVFDFDTILEAFEKALQNGC